jgi:hypothetical protein
MKPKEFNLKELYEDACNCASDIYMHLPVLYQYAQDCDHVTEMGARGGNSTKAFLYANPKKFVSYDYQYETPEPHLKNEVDQLISIFEKSKEIGVNCQYIGADVLTVEIEETDLLFIDTWHCYSQLHKELELHSTKVKKYIAFHDTSLYGIVGEGYPSLDINHPNRNSMDGSGGILRAIEEFLYENLEWNIEYQSKDNNGLIIITK